LAKQHNEADKLYFFLRAFFFLAAFFAFLAMQIPLRVVGRTGGRARPGTSAVELILSGQSKFNGDNLARGPQRDAGTCRRSAGPKLETGGMLKMSFLRSTRSDGAVASRTPFYTLNASPQQDSMSRCLTGNPDSKCGPASNRIVALSAKTPNIGLI
jgi:hypothetical protein